MTTDNAGSSGGVGSNHSHNGKHENLAYTGVDRAELLGAALVGAAIVALGVLIRRRRVRG